MNIRRVRGLLIAGMMFLGMYIVIAWMLHNFRFPNFHYMHNIPLFMGGIPSVVMYSQFWKLLLLVPAVLLFSAAYIKSGIGIPRLTFIHHRFFVPGLLLVVAAILLLSTQFLFHETEVTDDENTYDFQAKTLLAGRINNPPPPVQTSFDNVFMINDGRSWIGRYTMGHPAVIALGMILGDRYVGILILSVLTLLLLYLIARELYNEERVALLALLLGAASPFFYFMSSSRLSHTTTAFFLGVFMYLLLRARREDHGFRAAMLSLGSGLALGYAFNTRPWTAFAWSLPLLMVMARDAFRLSKNAVAKGALLTAGFAVLFFITLHCNAVITGNPMQFPYSYFDSTERIGFGGPSGHTIFIGIRNLIVSLTRLNVILFGFPISLLFVFIFLIAKKEFGDRLCYGILGSIAAAYLLFYTPGVSDLGPVYYYELLLPLLLLSARGILYLHELCSRHFELGKRFVPAFLLVSYLAALGTTVPERISHISRLTEQIRQPYTAVEHAGIHHALVMIQPYTYAGWVFGYRNPSPGFTDDVVYCQYADSVSNHDVVAYFHDRAPYLLKYDSTAAGFIVLPVNKEAGAAGISR